jgi:hypothetical protein
LNATYLQATKSVLERFDLRPEALQPAPPAKSRLGNWTVNFVPIAKRHAYLFMSDRTYLNFPIFQGKKKVDLQDIPGFLQHGVSQVLGHLGVDQARIEEVLAEFSEVAVTRVQDKSSLAMHAAIVADYAHVLRGGGGVGPENITGAVLRVNGLPRRKLGWATSSEATLEVLPSSAA